jgi:hypothetical protein
MQKKQKLNITITGKSEYNFWGGDFGKFKFSLGKGRIVYYHDEFSVVKQDDDDNITIKLKDVPFDFVGQKVTLTDIEMDLNHANRIIYPMLRIDDIKTNIKSIKINIKLDEDHDQYIVYRDEEPVYDDPTEVHVMDRYGGWAIDLRFCGACTHIKEEEYLKYIKYICFKTDDVEYRIPFDKDNCTVPDYVVEDREYDSQAVLFDLVFNASLDEFNYNTSAICDIIFNESTPPDLKFRLDTVLDECGCGVDIKFKKKHDPHIAYVDE